jgi:hypothetical protein
VPKNEETVIPEGISSIPIHVTVQRPPQASEKAPDDKVELECKPQSRMSESYAFESCQCVSTEATRVVSIRKACRPLHASQTHLVSSLLRVPEKATLLTINGRNAAWYSSDAFHSRICWKQTLLQNELPLLDKTRQHKLAVA